jgi:hypothetical protein
MATLVVCSQINDILQWIRQQHDVKCDHWNWEEADGRLTATPDELIRSIGDWLLASYHQHCTIQPNHAWSLAALGYLAMTYLINWPLASSVFPTIDHMAQLLHNVERRQCIPRLDRSSNMMTDHGQPLCNWQQPRKVVALFDQWSAYIEYVSEYTLNQSWADPSRGTTLTSWLPHLDTITRHVLLLGRFRLQIEQRQQKRLHYESFASWFQTQVQTLFQVEQPLEFRVQWQEQFYHHRLGLGLIYAYRQQNPLASHQTPLEAVVRTMVPGDELTALLRPINRQTPAQLLQDDSSTSLGRELMILTAWSHLFFARFHYFWLDRYFVPASRLTEWTFAKFTEGGFRRTRPCVILFMGHWWVIINERFFCHCTSATSAILSWIAAVVKCHRGKLETDQSLADWINECEWD